MEPRIVEEHAHQLIESLPYSHPTVLTQLAFRVVFGCCGMKDKFMVEILTTSEHSIHVLIKVPNESYTFLRTVIYASLNFAKHKLL